MDRPERHQHLYPPVDNLGKAAQDLAVPVLGVHVDGPPDHAMARDEAKGCGGAGTGGGGFKVKKAPLRWLSRKAIASSGMMASTAMRKTDAQPEGKRASAGKGVPQYPSAK